MNWVKNIQEWYQNRSGVQYDGVQYENYKKKRNKWIRLAVIGVVIPYALPFVLSFFDESLNVIEMIGNGEILLSLFALVLPLAFDLLEAKNQKDDELEKAFWLCIVITTLLLVVYSGIRLTTPSITELLQEKDMSKLSELIAKREALIQRNIFCSVGLSVSSVFCCNRAIIALYNHTDILTKGGEK